MPAKASAPIGSTKEGAEKGSLRSNPSVANGDFSTPSAGKTALPPWSGINSNSARVAQREKAGAGVGLESMPEPVVPRMSAPSYGKGLPAELRHGIESLSGLSMEHVSVHYNSSRPAQVQAHAFAQGSEIHLGPGQEEHLPHEAWHVVQQAQGRVRPTMQMKGNTPVNDDRSLELEADAMGDESLDVGKRMTQQDPVAQMMSGGHNAPLQLMPKGGETKAGGGAVASSAVRVAGPGFLGVHYEKKRSEVEKPEEVSEQRTTWDGERELNHGSHSGELKASHLSHKIANSYMGGLYNACLAARMSRACPRNLRELINELIPAEAETKAKTEEEAKERAGAKERAKRSFIWMPFNLVYVPHPPEEDYETNVTAVEYHGPQSPRRAFLVEVYDILKEADSDGEITFDELETALENLKWAKVLNASMSKQEAATDEEEDVALVLRREQATEANGASSTHLESESAEPEDRGKNSQSKSREFLDFL